MQIKLNIERTDIKFGVDAENLKALEDMLVRALHRALVGAVRQVVKEELLGNAFKQIAQAQPAVAEVIPPPPKEVPITRLPEKAARGVRKSGERRSVRDVCKVVPERPHGYIDRAEAIELLGGPSNSGILSTWILAKEVAALIVRDGKLPPTKGLPGRLMVNKESLLKRDAQRQQHPLYTKPPANRINARAH